MSRVTIDDLLLGADWCEGYEAQDDDPNGERLQVLADWLREEAKRRETAKVARQLARESGRRADDPKVRAYARNVTATKYRGFGPVDRT